MAPTPHKRHKDIHDRAKNDLKHLPKAKQEELTDEKLSNYNDCITIQFPGYVKWLDFFDRDSKHVHVNKIAAYNKAFNDYKDEITDILDSYKLTFSGRALLAEINAACKNTDHPDDPKALTISPTERLEYTHTVNAD